MAAVEERRGSGGNAVAAILALLVFGYFWLVGLASLVDFAFGGTVSFVWVLAALGLGGLAVRRILEARDRPGRVWLQPVLWWLASFVAPIILVVELIRLAGRRSGEPDTPTPVQGEPMTDTLLSRLDSVELRLADLQREVRELRAQAVAGRAAERPPSPSPAPGPRPVPEPAPPEPTPLPRPTPAPPPPPPAAAAPPRREPVAPPAPPAPPPRPPRELDLADLLGARTLAWAGGLVTLLGVVFFFVLAVNRGWIGPVERVGLGALASALVFGAGLVMRARYGQLYSAFAAVGAGLAGGYATLLAAAALYELVPDLVALGIAAAIAAVGVVTALRWSAETVAGIGLVGAMVVPLSVVFDGGISIVGTAFAAVMLAATAIVAVRRRWDGLLAAGGAVALVQAAWLVFQEGEGASGSVVAVAASMWLLGLAIGIARQLRTEGDELNRLAVPFVLASTAFAGTAAVRLLNGELLGAGKQGLALLAVAVVSGVAGAVLFRRRDLSALLGAAGLAVGGIALADLLGGQSLALAWAAEAAVLAWLAARIGEIRYHAAALVYLLLALGHALVFDAPLRDLVDESAHPAGGVAALVAVALAAVVFGRYAREWKLVAAPSGPIGRAIADVFQAFAELRPLWRTGAFAAAGVLVLYAAALGLLEAFVQADDAFEWGHVAVTAFWAAVATGVFVAGLRRPVVALQYAGLVWLGVTLVKLVGYDVVSLGATERGLAALAVAVAALVTGFLVERAMAEDGTTVLGGVLLAASAGLAAYGSVTLVPDDLGSEDGLALLAVAAVYGALAATVFARRLGRGLATVLGALALLLALPASELLLSGTWLVASWAAAAAVLAWLATRLEEPRLHPAALALAVLALGATLVQLAPPVDLLVADREPAVGVPALLLCLGAVLALARFAPIGARVRDRFDAELVAAGDRWRTWAFWSAGVVALYAGSLALLGAAMWAGGADLETEFQRGHTVVSAFWGVVGLAALYLGLRRYGNSVRLAGFALFGISLAKIFLYDLSRLSSVARALSFLAVGAVLLLGGFFYQRLSAEMGGRRARPS